MWRFMLIGLFALGAGTTAQAALMPGDVAVVGINMDDPDAVALVALSDLGAGEELRLTDNGWFAAGGFRNSEGVVSFTVPAGGIAAGTIFDPLATATSVSGSFLFSTSGDQLLIYQGTEAAPTFIFALNDEGNAVWQADATTSSTSALPPGVPNANVALFETDNLVVMDSILTGAGKTKDQWLAAITTPLNWTGSATPLTMPTGSILVTAPAADPVINEFVANHTGADNMEFVEIFGDPGADYSAFSVLEIEGDGAGGGTIDGVFSLGATDGDGFFFAGFFNNEIENGSMSLLLVENFSGVAGDDIDADNDGVIDNAPWSRIVDDVAVFDGDGGDLLYSLTVLAPDFDGDPFTPGGASRFPDGTDTDSAQDWLRNAFDLSADTPGAPNQGPPGGADVPEPSSLLLLALGGGALLRRRRRPGRPSH